MKQFLKIARNRFVGFTAKIVLTIMFFAGLWWLLDLFFGQFLSTFMNLLALFCLAVAFIVSLCLANVIVEKIFNCIMENKIRNGG